MHSTDEALEKSTYVSGLLEREVLFLDKFGCRVDGCVLVNSGRQTLGKTLQIVETHKKKQEKSIWIKERNFSPQ